MSLSETLYAPQSGQRFLTTFLMGLVPSPTDFRFQSVAGLGRVVETRNMNSGGRNSRGIPLPEPMRSGDITLSRGLMPVTPAAGFFEYSMRNFEFNRFTLLLFMFGDGLAMDITAPVACWSFSGAIITSWQLGDISAERGDIAINHIGISYQKCRWWGTKA